MSWDVEREAEKALDRIAAASAQVGFRPTKTIREALQAAYRTGLADGAERCAERFAEFGKDTDYIPSECRRLAARVREGKE